MIEAQERAEFLRNSGLVLSEELVEDAAAYVAGVPHALGWLCTDLLREGLDSVALQLAVRGDADGDPEATYCLGLLLEDEGDLVGAADAYRRAIPVRHAAFRLGDTLRKLGDKEGAERVFGDYARSDAECATELVDLERGDLNELKDILITHLRSGVLDVLIPLARVYEDLGQSLEAQECLRISVLSGEANAPWNYSVMLDELGRDGSKWALLAAHEGDSVAQTAVAARYGPEWRLVVAPESIASRADVLADLGTVRVL